MTPAEEFWLYAYLSMVCVVAGIAIVAVLLHLWERRVTPAEPVDCGIDEYEAKAAEWAAIVAAVEGDWAAWEQEVAER